MKIEAQISKNIENNDSAVRILPEDADMLSLSSIPFSDMLSGQMNNLGIDDNGNGFNFSDADFNYDAISMELEDALFFVNLAQEGQFSVENTQNGEFKNLIQTNVVQSIVSQKTVEVTNKLTELIEKAQNTQKPVRITFDKDVSVVLKIDKHGRITAEFIPGNIEVENYLRNNIASLRQRFDEQNLPYNDLLYRQSNKQNKNKNNKGEK